MEKKVTARNDAWIDLLNSDWHDHLGSGRTEDRLDNREWLRRFLSRWEADPSLQTLHRTPSALRRLRTLLRGMVDEVLDGRPISDGEWDALNRVLAGGPMIRRFQASGRGGELTLLPKTRGLEAVMADIAASFAAVFTEGDPHRIKLCANPDCRWVIYDHSKSRTRRWCEGPSGCGNLIKVRRHRARKKHTAS